MRQRGFHLLGAVAVWLIGLSTSGSAQNVDLGGNVGLVRAGVAATIRRELDDATIGRADVIVVNSREQAIQDEQGDLFEPVKKGILTWDKVGELGALLNGEIPGRTSHQQTTVFKNNAGQGVADVAVASLVYAIALKNNIGMEF